MMSQSWNNKKRGAGGGNNTPRGSWKQGGSGGAGRGGGSDPAKKPRPAVSQDDDDMMDTEEMEMAFLEDSEMMDDDMTEVGEEVQVAKSITFSQWERPALKKDDFSPKKHKLTFQQIDVDHYINSTPVSGMPGARIGPVPVIRYAI